MEIFEKAWQIWQYLNIVIIAIFKFVENCSPKSGNQENCPAGQHCYTDGVCATQCTPKDGGNCPSGLICTSIGICGNSKFILRYHYEYINDFTINF